MTHKSPTYHHLASFSFHKFSFINSNRKQDVGPIQGSHEHFIKRLTRMTQLQSPNQVPWSLQSISLMHTKWVSVSLKLHKSILDFISHKSTVKTHASKDQQRTLLAYNVVGLTNN